MARRSKWKTVEEAWTRVYKQQTIRREAYALVREQLKCVAERNKDYYDVRVKPAAYSVGQFVYLYTPRRRPGRSYKWEKLYSGPHLIVQVMGPVNVRIQKSPRSKCQIVHIDKIKIFHGPTPKPWISTGPTEDQAVATGSDNENVQDGGSAPTNANEQELRGSADERGDGPYVEPVASLCENVQMTASQSTDPKKVDPQVSAPNKTPKRKSSDRPEEKPPILTDVNPRPKRNAGRPKRYLYRVICKGHRACVKRTNVIQRRKQDLSLFCESSTGAGRKLEEREA